MISKLKKLFLGLVACVGGASAAPLDTAQLGDITASLDTAASWLSGPVTVAVVGLVVAAMVLGIVKFVGRKAKP